jgi:hypothetical protein
MNVQADPLLNLVTIRGDRGTEITMNWAAAAYLSTLLNEASRQAEPPAFPGRSYCPSVERDRR